VLLQLNDTNFIQLKIIVLEAISFNKKFEMQTKAHNIDALARLSISCSIKTYDYY